MAVTYTNRRGVTFFLCQALTKHGKPRYYVAREPKGMPVDAIPDGFRFVEHANGLVFLERERPALFLPEEITSVEAALARHPQPSNYHVRAKRHQIVISESSGLGMDEQTAKIFSAFSSAPRGENHIQEIMDRQRTFLPVLRFSLIDVAQRRFIVHRWCFKGRIDDWIEVGMEGQMADIAAPAVARLGSDAFFAFSWGDKQ